MCVCVVIGTWELIECKGRESLKQKKNKTGNLKNLCFSLLSTDNAVKIMDMKVSEKVKRKVVGRPEKSSKLGEKVLWGGGMGRWVGLA